MLFRHQAVRTARGYHGHPSSASTIGQVHRFLLLGPRAGAASGSAKPALRPACVFSCGLGYAGSATGCAEGTMAKLRWSSCGVRHGAMAPNCFCGSMATYCCCGAGAMSGWAQTYCCIGAAAQPCWGHGAVAAYCGCHGRGSFGSIGNATGFAASSDSSASGSSDMSVSSQSISGVGEVGCVGSFRGATCSTLRGSLLGAIGCFRGARRSIGGGLYCSPRSNSRSSSDKSATNSCRAFRISAVLF
mmetsp:Transcript_83184/g.178335  ORF Transcript_83184/g.178335 Transcript_83184/m.178335 type:complete len:245 (+) Transcript_83184:118-852(+)